MTACSFLHQFMQYRSLSLWTLEKWLEVVAQPIRTSLLKIAIPGSMWYRSQIVLNQEHTKHVWKTFLHLQYMSMMKYMGCLSIDDKLLTLHFQSLKMNHNDHDLESATLAWILYCWFSLICLSLTWFAYDGFLFDSLSKIEQLEQLTK